MTIALARRYRPKYFTDLLVQDHVAAVLRGAVAHRRVGHGYLLTGPRGVGKTTAARLLAMALNCEQPDAAPAPGEPCGECDGCRRIWTGSASLDVVEIDAASNRGVDDARDLRERAMYASSKEGGYKIYIVDEAHMLTREAWNALLKILEEPPPRVVFVFATTDPQKIASTAAPVLSRLQRFDFRRIGPAAIHQRLREVVDAEGITADEDALTLIARRADGGMRDALSVLDQCLSMGEDAVTTERVREVLGAVDDELYAELLELIVERQPARVFPLVDRLMEAGADLGEFTAGAAEMLRALLMLKVGATPRELTEAMRQTLAQYLPRIEAGDLLRMLKLLAEGETGIRRSVNPRLIVETLLLRWAMMDRIVDLEQVLAGSGGGATLRKKDSALGGLPEPRAPAEPPSPDLSDRLSSAELPPPPPPPGDLSEAWLSGHWSDLVAAARVKSPFLGEALASARPLAVAGSRVTLEMSDVNPIFQETLERQHRQVEALLATHVGAAVTIGFASRPSEGSPEAETEPGESNNPRPRRLSDAQLKAERLEATRAADAALDAAADALDLEIVD
jgi:DNA polymerase-3 subunit gamma/tau